MSREAYLRIRSLEVKRMSGNDGDNSLQDQLQRLEQLVSEYEGRLAEVRQEAAVDGVISPEERTLIERVEEKLGELRQRREMLRQQLISDPPASDGSSVDSEDSDNIEDSTAATNVTELEQIDISVGMARFDDPDSGFHERFRDSIHEWCQDGGIALNNVRNYMQGSSSSSGLSLNDIGSVIRTIFPPTGPIFVVVSMGQIVGRAFNSYLSASGSEGPSLAEIHRAWNEAIRGLDARRTDISLYESFVQDYKRANGIPRDTEEAVRADFIAACNSFRETHMPSVETVERVFTNQILSTVEDRDNPLAEDYNFSGIACMTVFFDMQQETVGEIRGYIDDCDSDMLNAVLSTYHGAKVIELPLAIRVGIMSGRSSRQVATLWRGNHSPGGTDFRLQEGSELALDAFLRARVYNEMMVSHLRGN